MTVYRECKIPKSNSHLHWDLAKSICKLNNNSKRYQKPISCMVPQLRYCKEWSKLGLSCLLVIINSICSSVVQGQMLHVTNFCCHFPKKWLLFVSSFHNALSNKVAHKNCHKTIECIPLSDQKCHPLANSLPWKMNIFMNPHLILKTLCIIHYKTNR